MRRILVAWWVGTMGCVVDQGLKAVDSVPRAVSEASRTHSVGAWAGRYAFSECAPNQAQPVCWTYEIVIDGGMATVRADGPQTAVHVNAKPEVDDGFLMLPFDSYIDGGPATSLHLPFQKPEGFGGSELLAKIGHDQSGHWCLVFGALQSPLRSRWVCAR